MHQSVLSKILGSLILWKLGPVRMTWSPTISVSDTMPRKHRPEILSKFSYAPASLTVQAVQSTCFIFSSH